MSSTVANDMIAKLYALLEAPYAADAFGTEAYLISSTPSLPFSTSVCQAVVCRILS